MLSVIKENKLIQMKICNISAEKNGIYGIIPEKNLIYERQLCEFLKWGEFTRQGDSLVVKHLLGIYKAMGSVPSTEGRQG